MKKLFTVLVCLFLAISTYAGYGAFGTCNSFIALNSTVYKVASCSSADPSFNGTNLGTITTLTLNEIQFFTFQNSGDNVMNASLNYRIYAGAASGSYTVVNLSNVDNGYGGTGGNKRWYVTPGTDLLSGLTPSTTYTLEVYYQADVDWNVTDEVKNADIYESNSGSNFKVTFTTDAPLPIELSSFTANKQANSTQLNWTTSTEENNDFFTIEKSLDGVNFKAIGTKAGAGNSLEAKEYNFIDANPTNGVNYYRLKQTDFDGRFTYSKMVSVDFQTKVQTTIYPNPTSEKLTISTETQEVVNIRIFNVNGQVVYQNTQRIDNQTNINLSELAAGNYFLIIANDATQKTIYSSNFIKE